MARKPTRAAAQAPAARSKKPAPEPKASSAPAKKNGVSNGAAAAERVAGRAPKTAAEARADLLARGAEYCSGGVQLRSDPLADAQAARLVVEFAQAHSAELQRRGL